MPGMGLTEAANVIGMSLFSSARLEVMGLGALVKDGERARRQAVDANAVERAHGELQQRVALGKSEIVAFSELRRRLEIGLAALRPAVDVADKLLQRIKAHRLVLPSPDAFSPSPFWRRLPASASRRVTMSIPWSLSCGSRAKRPAPSGLRRPRRSMPPAGNRASAVPPARAERRDQAR